MRPSSIVPLVRIGRSAPRLGAVVGLCALGCVVLPGTAIAADPTTTITIGESNSSAQVEELLASFGARGDEPVTTVTVDETARAMEGIFDTSGITSAYSSTALTCLEQGAGLEVATRNITVVAPALYAMALATAGIDDATLVVAAPDDAPAEGMTALTGVFAAAERGACPSSASEPGRQRLALEELALTAEIAAALGADDASGAAAVVLGVQQEVVAGRTTDPAAIEAAVAAQEDAAGVAIPDEQRTELVDLMGRLARAELDWGSFAAGWELDRNQAGTGVAMTGRAVGGQAAPTGTTAAPTTAAPTAPAPTATPTPTPTPAPTATPAPTPTAVPFTVQGRIVDAGGDWVIVGRDGTTGAPETYAVAPGAAVSRAGEPATMDRIEPDDAVAVTVAGNGELALEIVATPPAATPGVGDRLRGLWPLLLGGLLVSAAGAGAAVRRKGRVLAYLAPSSSPPAPTVPTAPTAGPVRRRLWFVPRRRGDRPGGHHS